MSTILRRTLAAVAVLRLTSAGLMRRTHSAAVLVVGPIVLDPTSYQPGTLDFSMPDASGLIAVLSL